MTETRRINPRWWIWFGLALTAVKLWLSRGQGIYALGNAGHDDLLFIQLAEHLLHGDWLGPYNELTLAKGAAYPLFIAAAFSIGIPLFLAQHLLYAGACALFSRALRPALAAPSWRFAIFVLLLWNPMTFDAPSMGRVLRQNIYGPLGLLIFTGLIALYLRRNESFRRQAPWALLLGFAAGVFYLTREEVLWLTPSALVLVAAYVLGAWKISRSLARRATGLLMLGIAAAALPVLSVCAKNLSHYGWFGTSEFRARPFSDAYSAMLRVKVGPELPYIPVTRDARSAMAEVSPAFAELQKQFDTGIARSWAGASEFFTHIPAEQDQIGGGWMIWALRDATARAGHHSNAAEALRFYGLLAAELNQACDDGRLPSGPHRSGFMPPWRETQTGPFLSATLEFADFLISFRHFSARPPASSGSPESLQLFRDLTRERISPPAGELDVVGAARYVLNLRKVEWLQTIGRTLRSVLLWLFIVAQVLFLLRLLQVALQRQWSFPLTVAAAAWGACAASVLMHAMIEVTSFPVRTVSSFAPVYPLLLVFIIATLWDAVITAKAITAKRRTASLIAVPKAPLPSKETPPLGTAVRIMPWLVGMVALAPFLIWRRQFAELFWFGDDFFLLDQMASIGLVGWIDRVFSENFVPLFKLLWGGAVLTFNGSYAVMLWLLWLTHALNTFILGRVLIRASFPWLATMATLLVFALTPANIETLGWSVQWSAVLATTFLLLGLDWQQRAAASITGFSWRLHPMLAALAGASACSFSRGVLTGPILALACLLPAAGDWRLRTWAARTPGALLCLLPAVAVALLIGLNSNGNHLHMDGHWGDALEFGLSYLLFNPGQLLLGDISLNPATLLLLASGKLIVIFTGLWLSSGKVRTLLLLLLAYDLGNALLVGVGRHHTGFLASLSSRYQYSSLLATLPYFTLLLSRGLDRVFIRPLPRQWAAITSIALLTFLCLRGWPAALASFTGWRGTEVRRLLAAPATSDPDVRVPALEFMHVERAKALQRAYNLH